MEVIARFVIFCTIAWTNHEFSPWLRPFSRPTIIAAGLPSSNDVSGQSGNRPPNGRLPDKQNQRWFSPLAPSMRRENLRPFAVRPRSRTKGNRPCADLALGDRKRSF